jgi:mRNA-degrading endonuclease toxin of MazEF toxin-antitoxin module
MRGRILHHYSRIAGKTKFLVVLNDVWPPADGFVVYAFLTSNVERVRRLSQGRSPIVVLPAGSYPCCTVETAIDLTQIISEPFATVSSAASYKEIAQVSADDMAAIRDAVRRSTIIARRLKNRILGES